MLTGNDHRRGPRAPYRLVNVCTSLVRGKVAALLCLYRHKSAGKGGKDIRQLSRFNHHSIHTAFHNLIILKNNNPSNPDNTSHLNIMATPSVSTVAPLSLDHSTIRTEPKVKSHSLKPLMSLMAWEGSQFSQEDSFIVHLTAADIAEVDEALASFQGSSISDPLTW